MFKKSSFVSLFTVISLLLPTASAIAATTATPVAGYGTQSGFQQDPANDWAAFGSHVVWFTSPSGQSPFVSTHPDGQLMMTDVGTGSFAPISDPLYELSNAAITNNTVIWGSKDATSGIYQYDFTSKKVSQLIAKSSDTLLGEVAASVDGKFAVYSTDTQTYEVLDVAQNKTQSVADFLQDPDVDVVDQAGNTNFVIGPDYIAASDINNHTIVFRRFVDTAATTIDYTAFIQTEGVLKFLSMADKSSFYVENPLYLNNGYYRVAMDTKTIAPVVINDAKASYFLSGDSGLLWKQGSVYNFFNESTQMSCPTNFTKADGIENASHAVLTGPYIYWADSNGLRYKTIQCDNSIDDATLQKLQQTSDIPGASSLPVSLWTVPPGPKGTIAEYGDFDVANDVIAANVPLVSAKDTTKFFNTLTSGLQKLSATVPKSIKTQAAANDYLKTHPDVFNKLMGTVASAGGALIANAFGGVTSTQSIIVHKISTGKNFTIPTIGMPQLNSTKPWSVGPTGLAWFRVVTAKKITTGEVHWYDFATKKDTVVQKITAANMADLLSFTVHAEYQSLILETHSKSGITAYSAWNTKTGKLVKQLQSDNVGENQMLTTVVGGSHYIAWALFDTTTNAPALHVLDMNTGKELGYPFYGQIRTIKLYGDTAVMSDGNTYAQVDLKNFVTTEIPLPPILQKHSERELLSFDGARLVFKISQPDSLVILPLAGGDPLQYAIDFKSSTYIGVAGNQIVTKVKDDKVTMTEAPVQKNDPLEIARAIKTLQQYKSDFMKGLINVAKISMYKF